MQWFYVETQALSLQDSKDKHLSALGNLGRITDHRGRLDAAKTEEHASPDCLRPANRDVESSVHGMVHPVKDTALDMDLNPIKIINKS